LLNYILILQKEDAMIKFKLLMVLFLFFLLICPSFADYREKILGSWKVISYELESKDTGKRVQIMGKNPTGYMIFTPEGRFITIITGEGRKPANTDQDRVELLKSLIAFTGKYYFEGEKIIVKVDVTWNPAWIGTDQPRIYKFETGKLHIITAWSQHPQMGMARGYITLEREK
jgi:hypothetical protein